MRERPAVGVAAVILREGKILLGKRRGAHGAGAWSFPGGHLESGESAAACARREVLEETGLMLRRLLRGPYTEDVFPSGKHYVTLYFLAESAEGEPRLAEPEKCEAWEWFSWDALPEPLFLPVRNLKASGFHPRAFLPPREKPRGIRKKKERRG